MPYLQLSAGPEAPTVVRSVTEIPKGSSNKYEFRLSMETIVLDRVLYSPIFYPCDYGWIPGTLSENGDPLDILVLITHPTFPGCVVPARPIGALRMTDEHGPDTKILAVCDCDPRYAEVRQLEDVPEHGLAEITHFFQAYKELEEKKVEVFGWEGRETAHLIIREGLKRARGVGTDGLRGEAR